MSCELITTQHPKDTPHKYHPTTNLNKNPIRYTYTYTCEFNRQREILHILLTQRKVR